MSQDETETNISDIIDRLVDDDDDEDDGGLLDIDPGMQLDLIGGAASRSKFCEGFDLDPAATAAAAVQDILGGF